METEKEIIDLVIARLQNLPFDKEISIGSSGEFTKEELIEHVKNDDSIGQKMVAIEMDFLRSMKEGVFYE
ncbi:hypothetical protein A2121_01340 [Candidatus Nomurabacteria bacterium GWB1_40_6]|jgi:hypothetical protein|uniref:Uncharacterized protein n=1 Tax=Candidatus Nomurabacteria bacterium GWB1_40_6 TaxID=1801727 RepID=A0A1F6TLX3_9BACT|nr:MAG: hypothetical protein A2121_01340 [Candidatus Nomurabacteria bacterium GWB1_40_6]